MKIEISADKELVLWNAYILQDNNVAHFEIMTKLVRFCWTEGAVNRKKLENTSVTIETDTICFQGLKIG